MKIKYQSFILYISVILWWIFFGFGSQAIFAENVHNDVEERLEMYISKHEQEVAGLATILWQDGEVLTYMEGFSDIEKQIAVDENTVFEWASVSKVLIWISVMQLVEQGKLDLDANIARYLPDEFQGKESFKEPITMRHLMHHTAGFDDSYTDLMVISRERQSTLKTTLENADIKQVFSPGEIVAYSNYSSGLAAYIVEVVSEMDYRDYVRENIFGPLGMTKTAIDPLQEDQKWVQKQRESIMGYTPALTLIEPNLYTIPIYPAGSVMGTATDLQKLLQALLADNDTPLFQDKTTIDLMFEPTLYYPNTTIPRVANGFFYLPSERKSVYGHGGNSKAFSSSFYLDRETKTGVIVLTNVQNETTFTAGIPEIIFGKYAPESDGGVLEHAAKWAGVYEPARLPRHGYASINSLFTRSYTKQEGDHYLRIGDLSYTQLAPSVYVTKDDYSMYSVDVYTDNSKKSKILSNMYSDLIYIPLYKHYLEWIGLVLAIVAGFFSFVYLLVMTFKKVKYKKAMPVLLYIQHIFNVVVLSNIFWICYKTISMVSYSYLQPFLIFNMFYIIFSIVLNLLLFKKLKKNKLYRKQKVILLVTVVFTIIICTNMLYWEFYH